MPLIQSRHEGERTGSTSLRNRGDGKALSGACGSLTTLCTEALRSGHACVSDVVAATGLPQPSVSMHLACLWDCGLAERERRGRFVEYRIADARLSALRAAGEGLLSRVGDLVYVCTRYPKIDAGLSG